MLSLFDINIKNANYKIINDNYLLIVKNYKYNKYNCKDFFNTDLCKDIKHFENYLIYFELINFYKGELKDYEIIIHNYCMKKFMDIYYNWYNILLKIKIFLYY